MELPFALLKNESGYSKNLAQNASNLKQTELSSALSRELQQNEHRADVLRQIAMRGTNESLS